MFSININEELTTAILSKMLERFHLNNEIKLCKYKDYFDGKQKILSKSYSDPSKPCNKTVINYCKNIVDSYCGYIASPGCINYSSKDDIEELLNILRYNDYQSQDSNLLLDALVYGVSAELMYLDALGQVRFKSIDPRTCFGIYDDSLSNDLLYFVRFYRASEWDNSNKYFVDVYSDYDVKHYYMFGLNGQLVYTGEEKHYFSQCPANIFYLPDEKSIFDCILTQQDSINELLSAEIDDYSAFCDAYMVIKGAELDPDSIAEMKVNRVLEVPVDATVEYLTKQGNDTQTENILKRLHDSIYRTAQCPDFSSETFIGGVSSGIAIRYRLTGMETRAGIIEAEMKKALQRRIEIICGIASLRYGEEMFRDIQITFQRNIPEDETAIINRINSLKGLISDKTLLSQLDFIEDVDAELEAIEKQKTANMAIYQFGSTFGIEEDVE